jgi:hypothetical protein
MFAGRPVRVTHTNERLVTETGICKTIHVIPGSEDQFDMEMIDGRRYGFVPEKVTSDSVEGELRALAGGRRKIQIVRAESTITSLAELYAARKVTLLALELTTILAREAVLRGDYFKALMYNGAIQRGLRELDAIDEKIALTEQALGLL